VGSIMEALFSVRSEILDDPFRQVIGRSGSIR
jgi:hypothetical protein